MRLEEWFANQVPVAQLQDQAKKARAEPNYVTMVTPIVIKPHTGNEHEEYVLMVG